MSIVSAIVFSQSIVAIVFRPRHFHFKIAWLGTKYFSSQAPVQDFAQGEV